MSEPSEPFNRARISVTEALAHLPGSEDEHFATLMQHGGLEVGIYAPRGKDLQTPHLRDEIYVVIRGKGVFLNGTSRHPFEAGDVLFVAAGVEHRFKDFTEDFAVWVIFFGPEGKEQVESELET